MGGGNTKSMLVLWRDWELDRILLAADNGTVLVGLSALTKLSDVQQDSMAQWILDELEDEARWDRAFTESPPQLEMLGEKALEDFRAGRTEELDPDNLK